MQNAKDAKIIKRYMVIGPTGVGKSTLALTLPGRKFAYVLDPAGLSAIQGWDVDYEMWTPNPLELNPYPASVLKRDTPGGTPSRLSDAPKDMPEPQLYLRWIDDYREKFEKKFFEDYDLLIIDSLTLLARALMAREAWLQDQKKREDERTDHKIGGEKFTDAMLGCLSIPITSYCTVHNQYTKDDTTAKKFNRLTLPGSSRVFIPRLFSDIFICHKTPGKFQIQTVPDRDNPTSKTSFLGLNDFEDVSIPESILRSNSEKEIINHGLGAILQGKKSKVVDIRSQKK